MSNLIEDSVNSPKSELMALTVLAVLKFSFRVELDGDFYLIPNLRERFNQSVNFLNLT